MDKFVFLLELIGTVAFAASGALTAMRRHMDLLGVIVLGVITSVGGGILRDVILGITPPLAFRDPTCTLVAVGVSLLLCIPWIRHSLMHNHRLFDVSLLLMDSVGLGVFTVMGIWNAMDFSPDRSTYLLVFVGLLTGVGGGVMRDVLAGNTPYILVKHVYACASLAGAGAVRRAVAACAAVCGHAGRYGGRPAHPPALGAFPLEPAARRGRGPLIGYRRSGRSAAPAIFVQKTGEKSGISRKKGLTPDVSYDRITLPVKKGFFVMPFLPVDGARVVSASPKFF